MFLVILLCATQVHAAKPKVGVASQELDQFLNLPESAIQANITQIQSSHLPVLKNIIGNKSQSISNRWRALYIGAQIDLASFQPELKSAVNS